MRETQTERKLRRAIEDEKGLADGAMNDELMRERQTALAYYNCDARGDEVENRSHLISQDLNASVTANLALMQGMLIEDGAVKCERMGPQDIQADAETQVVDRIIYQENEGEIHLMHAIKDGLISGNACLTCEVVEGDDDTPVTFEIRAVPSENISYQAAYDGKLQDIRFFREKRYYSRSDLVEMGVSKAKADKLSTGSDTNTRDRGKSKKDQGGDRATDTIETHINYIRCDMSGDGIAMLYRVLSGPNDEVLMHEEADVIPYCLGAPFIQPHRLAGESLYHKLKQTQDAQTVLLRGMADNIETMNNGRFIYDPSQVNEGDVMTPQAGGGIRSSNPTQAIVPMPIPDAVSGILAGMEHMKRRRSEVAGAAIDMSSADAQLMNKSATQASIDKSNSELVTSQIARNLALTLIKPLFRLVHEMVRTYGNAPYPVMVNGQPNAILGQQFNPNRMFSLSVGKTPGQKSQETQALMMHLQQQTMAMQAGMNGVLADANTLYATAKRLLELAGVEECERHMIDPASPQAQQAAQQQAQSAQQQAQAQQQLVDRQLKVEETKVAENSRIKDAEIEHDYYATDMDAAVAEAKIVGQGAIDLEKERTRLSGKDNNAGTAGGNLQ